ncbi:MAG: oxidoreductase [Mogibacterium sp.]|nr:oxidoreductase [Mogibacterium sp.]
MKQTARIISTYSADVMGVCSALYELGGMTVMHDASGCNSTYTTHDEPRWSDQDSMVFISGISEMEAIMGDDEKLIGDIEEAAKELHPRFIAVAGTPIPTMTGFDFEAVASVIEQRTGIPAFGFPTTGMNTYIHGASMALEGIAERFVRPPEGPVYPGSRIRVNILGLTPLDFSTNGTDASIVKWLRGNDFEVVSKWAMGCSLDELACAGVADVNLVISAAGLGAGRVMYHKFGIPSVIGLPIGPKQSEYLSDALTRTAEGYRMMRMSGVEDGFSGLTSIKIHPNDLDPVHKEEMVVLIGEGITNFSLANSIRFETGHKTKVLCATECPAGILREWDVMTPDEDDIIPELADAAYIIADPMYKPICPDTAKFIPLPSEAFSGRLYRDDIPDLIAHPEIILEQIEDSDVSSAKEAEISENADSSRKTDETVRSEAAENSVRNTRGKSGGRAARR